MEDAITKLVHLYIKSEEKIMDIESLSRRENIRIYGFPESTERDSPSICVFVESLLRDGLELDGGDINVERAHQSQMDFFLW